MRRALAIDEASYGPEHPDVASRPQQPGAVAPGHEPAGGGGAADAAGTGHRRSELRAGAPGRGHSLNNLARLLQATNRLAEAEPLMRRALAIDEASYGPEHPNVAIDLNNLAAVAPGHQPAGGGGAADAAGSRNPPQVHPRQWPSPPGHASRQRQVCRLAHSDGPQQAGSVGGTRRLGGTLWGRLRRLIGARCRNE